MSEKLATHVKGVREKKT